MCSPVSWCSFERYDTPNMNLDATGMNEVEF